MKHLKMAVTLKKFQNWTSREAYYQKSINLGETWLQRSELKQLFLKSGYSQLGEKWWAISQFIYGDPYKISALCFVWCGHKLASTESR